MNVHTATFRGHSFRIVEGSVHPAYSLAVFQPEGEEHDFREAHWHPKAGDVVVDVGASYGAYALTAAACGARVIAFEPEPTVAVDLERNVALNPGFDVQVSRDALGSKRGTINMREFAPHWPEQTISGPYYATTLDAYGLERLDWLKVDVEGWEVEVLKGAAETLKRCKPTLIVEVHTFLGAALLVECKEAIHAHGGYSIEEIPRDPCVLIVCTPEERA
jgi:FkbM family methyltransferase